MRRRFELAGWLLFLVCAFLFLGAGIRMGDAWTIWASVFFLAGVLAFLAPFFLGGSKED